ncbi:DUF4260 family protein [Staphylococcus hominis]|uniref:DUF4260 family protein n=1 Tax=Staphylococcus hominis TaxID=1290 RepID=UPI003A0D0A11
MLFILLPDISAISYLINESIGDALYNLVHSYITLFIFFLFFYLQMNYSYWKFF